MIFYRIEHHTTKLGPFHDGQSKLVNYVMNSQIFSEHKVLCATGLLCGCSTLQKLIEWFNQEIPFDECEIIQHGKEVDIIYIDYPTILDMLADNGYVIKKFEGPIESELLLDGQILFDRAKVKELCTIQIETVMELNKC